MRTQPSDRSPPERALFAFDAHSGGEKFKAS